MARSLGIPEFLRRTTAIVTVANFFFMQEVCYALPQGGEVVAGSATMVAGSDSLGISQTSHRAVFNWGSFNVASGETVTFNQPDANSVALNRIGSGSASQILGALNANGQVWLMNPNGVVFGSTAVVDVGGLLATTSSISDSDFMNGNHQFTPGSNASAGISNAGRIHIRDGGVAALVGNNVTNSGLIEAHLGKVQLASGDTFAFDLGGDGLINLEASPAVQQQLISNSGTILADGGQVLLTAAAAESAINSLINMDGLVQANSVGTKNGEVTFFADKGTTKVSGTVRAKGNDPGETGGKAKVLGKQVVVQNGAAIDASGDAGGGVIHVGGEYQGKGTTPTATTTLIEQGTTLKANAGTNGNGGEVIVWADGATRFLGNIEAKGGLLGGDGGFAETSGKQQLTVEGLVDATAANGNAGTWLIDPADISIWNRSQTGDGTNSFTTAELEAMSVGANVSLLATNNISLDLAGDTMNFTTAGRTFTLNAGNQISTASTGTMTTNNGAISFTGTSGNLFNHAFNLNSGGGAISLTGATTIGAATAINSGSGTVSIGTLSGAGALSLTFGSGTTSISGTVGGLTKAGAGTLTLGGNLDVNGAFALNGGTFTQSTRTLDVSGDFSLANGTTFTKSSNSSALTFDGTGTLTDSNATNQDLGAVVIGGTTTTRTLGSAATLSSLTINAGNTFSLAGNNLTRSASGAVTNNGTFRLQGGETLTNITNLGTAAGTVEYTGDGDGIADSYTIKDFGATDYFNLTLNSTDGVLDTFSLSGNLNAAGLLTLTTGTLNQGSGNAISSVGYTQNNGVFGGGDSAITISGNYSLFAGAFTSTSGTLTLNRDIVVGSSQTVFTKSGGTFTHNNGMVVFAYDASSRGSDQDFTVDVDAPLILNDVNVIMGNGLGASPQGLRVASGDTIVVEGTLTHTNGYLKGQWEAQGDIVVGAGADGGNSSNTSASLATSGTISLLVAGDQSITGNGGKTAGLYINKPSGTVSMGSTDLNITTFNLAAGNVISTSGTLTLGYDIVTGSNQTVFTKSGGTFDHNNGTVVFGYNASGRGSSQVFTVNLNAPLILNNVIVNLGNGNNGAVPQTLLASGSTIVVGGSLTHTNGVWNGNWEGQGNVAIGAGADGGTAALTFTGSNNQTFTDNGGTKTSGTVTINKSGGALSLLSNMSYNAAGQDLAITSGTFDLNGYNFTVNDQFTIGAAGTLRLQGAETFNKAPTISAGGTAFYYGTGASYTLQNWSYSNLTIAGGASSVFTQPANLTGINNLTISSGVLSQGGFNLSATTLSNDGTLRLRGNETLTLTNGMDTNSGTVEYTGDGDSLADSYTIKDFGTTDYYNLRIASADGATDSFAISGGIRLNGSLFQSAGTLNLGGNVTTAGGAVTLNDVVNVTGNSVTDTTDGGGSPAGATVAFGSTVNGGFDLTATANGFTFGGAWGGVTPLDDVSLTSVNSISLPSISAGSIFARSTGAASDLTLAGGVTLSASKAGTAATLVAGRNFINGSGAGAISTPAGRWLVYSTNPASDTIGGLSNGFRRFSCSFGGSCPALGSGNGLLYSCTPTLTVTPNALAGITYGDAVPNLTGYGYALSGYLGSDAAADNVTGSLTGSTTYTQGSNVGSYNVNYSSGSLASDMGYGFSYAANPTAITVGARAIGVTADARSKTYGAADPSLTYQITSGSLYGADGFSGALSRAAGESVAGGPYAIGQGTLTLGSNYSISYTGANLTINPAFLVVTADNKSKTVGTADPALSYGYTGLVNGDLTATFAGALARAAGETVAGAPYAIGQGTLSATGNYSIGTFNAGVFTIIPSTGNAPAAIPTELNLNAEVLQITEAKQEDTSKKLSLFLCRTRNRENDCKAL